MCPYLSVCDTSLKAHQASELDPLGSGTVPSQGMAVLYRHSNAGRALLETWVRLVDCLLTADSWASLFTILQLTFKPNQMQLHEYAMAGHLASRPRPGTLRNCLLAKIQDLSLPQCLYMCGLKDNTEIVPTHCFKGHCDLPSTRHMDMSHFIWRQMHRKKKQH